MLISASRRTDIPAYYSDWLFRRLAEGFADARNPMNPAQTRRVSLRPEDVDGIVLWSKNPAPMLPRLGDLAPYRYYFQFTLTPYGPGLEPGLPPKSEIAETFLRLAGAVGPRRVVWRYDPILFNADYPPQRHIDEFGKLAAKLRGSTAQCTVSFVDAYRSTRANAAKLNLMDVGDEERRSLARALSRIASEHGMALAACAEELDLRDCGVGQARCVDAGLFNALWGLNLPRRMDKNQRPACRCHESVDIGAYNTCPAGCLYCYANYNPAVIQRNAEGHEPGSAFLAR